MTSMLMYILQRELIVRRLVKVVKFAPTRIIEKIKPPSPPKAVSDLQEHSESPLLGKSFAEASKQSAVQDSDLDFRTFFLAMQILKSF
jgi:hypothetical protein